MGKDKKEKKAKKEKKLEANAAKIGKSDKSKKGLKNKGSNNKTQKLNKIEKAAKSVLAETTTREIKLYNSPDESGMADNEFDAMDFVTIKIGGKWKMKVVYALRDTASKRYSEIKARVPGITDMMLSSSLKELVEDGLVERKQFSEVPLRVEYQISELGERLIPALQMLVNWAIANR